MNHIQRSSSTTASPRRWSLDVPSILLAIVTIASPLLIGGVHAVTAAAIATVSILGLWWSLFASRGTESQTETFVLSIPALGFGFMALVCLIQLIPIPTALYGLLQPAGHSAVETSWPIVFGEPLSSGWHTLSLDPRQTTAHGLRWIALAATAALAARVIRGRSGRRLWLGFLLIVGAIIAAVGAAQHLSGTEEFLWFYQAQLPVRSISPFVSTNHAATFYGLMALIAIAFSLDHLRRSPLKTTLGALATTAGLLLCAAHGSDGALLALAVGVAILAISVFTRATAGAESSRKKIRVATIGVLALFFFGALAATMTPDDWTVAEEESVLETGSAEMRIHMAKSALQASTDHIAVGSGAGSVERVLPPYFDWNYMGPSTVPTIEAEPVEWALTMGPAVALVALLVFAFVALRMAPHILSRRGRRGASAAFSLLIFLGIIAVFHFPFATLGISLVAVVAIEACLDPERDPVFQKRSRNAAILFVAALTLAVGGLWMARTTVLAPGAEATLEVDDDTQLRRAVHLYPTDGVLLSAISLDARADGDGDRALALARRAFALRPHPQQQFLLASTLARVGERQEAARVYGSLFDQNRSRPHSFYGWSMPGLLFELPTAGLRATAFGDASPDLWRRFRRAIEDEESLQNAIDFALALVDIRPQRSEAHLQLIELYHRAEQPMLAEMYARTLISQNLEAPDGIQPAGLVFLLDLLAEQERYTEARSIAHRALSSGYGSPELSRKILELMPDTPGELSDRDRQLFETAVDTGCIPPYEVGHRQRCWQARAFFAELDADIDRAATLLGRIEHLHGDPRPLGRLLARHGRCRELAGLVRQYQGQRHHRSLERDAADCAHYLD